ncbi:MAG: hypothetical protein Kow0089_08430 [Desulfobulbaceae bacterium]
MPPAWTFNWEHHLIPAADIQGKMLTREENSPRQELMNLQTISLQPASSLPVLPVECDDDAPC